MAKKRFQFTLATLLLLTTVACLLLGPGNLIAVAALSSWLRPVAIAILLPLMIVGLLALLQAPLILVARKLAKQRAQAIEEDNSLRD